MSTDNENFFRREPYLVCDVFGVDSKETRDSLSIFYKMIMASKKAIYYRLVDDNSLLCLDGIKFLAEEEASAFGKLDSSVSIGINFKTALESLAPFCRIILDSIETHKGLSFRVLNDARAYLHNTSTPNSVTFFADSFYLIAGGIQVSDVKIKFVSNMFAYLDSTGKRPAFSKTKLHSIDFVDSGHTFIFGARAEHLTEVSVNFIPVD